MNYFEIHLVEHCNLKCQCCDNFSAIAEEEYLDEKVFTKDMKRMSKLFDIKWFRLLGGEPLLHPNINFFLKESRKYFPNSEIRLTTNGILLTKMGKRFWNTCRDHNIIVEITYYPIKLDWDNINKLGKENNVKIIYFDNKPTDKKISHRNPINDKGNQDIKYNFGRCYQVNHCISLKNGKIYPCTCIPNIYHFNKFFNKNIPVTSKDYIDIHEHDANEINEFLKHPVPFCAYCNVKNRTNHKPWATSKFDINEWFDEV